MRSGEATTELDGLRIPAAVRPVAEESSRSPTWSAVRIWTASTPSYATSSPPRWPASALAAAMRPAVIWAGGIIYAIGRINFLFDPAQTPYLRTEHVGVKQTTMANKARLILDAHDLGLMEPEYLREELLANHPLLSLVEINGLLVDVRTVSEPLQALIRDLRNPQS